MQAKIKNLQDLFAKFSDEQACRNYLVEQRWNGSPICPYCSNGKAYVIEGGKRFKCADKKCHKKFSVTVGTVFEDSNIPLKIWFGALYLITNHKKGISSLQLSRDLGITQKTAWFMLHRIREALKEKNSVLLGGEGQDVQVDETYIGGKHKREKDAKGEYLPRKTNTPVVGFYSKGEVIVHTVPMVTRPIMMPLILRYVNKASTLVTDSAAWYRIVGKEYQKHIIVSHSTGQYINRGYHTNGIENFWGKFKRGIYGIYHIVSPKHLHRYCDEFAYRYNSRHTPDSSRFEITLSKLQGRLTYKDLIKK
jgi:transposase-like protein